MSSYREPRVATFGLIGGMCRSTQKPEGTVGVPSAGGNAQPLMPARYDRRAADRSRAVAGFARGFTLLELLVTLAVLSLALVLILGYKAPWSTRLSLKGTAATLASELRLARSEAIAGNRPVSFVVDLDAHRYRVGDGAVRHLPRRITIALLTVAGERLGKTTGAIRFNPDGSSTGGRIALAEGGQRIAIGIDWLSGRVSVADVR
jgi:general secretion pathway protein H